MFVYCELLTNTGFHDLNTELYGSFTLWDIFADTATNFVRTAQQILLGILVTVSVSENIVKNQ